jgi:hypothetical protein
VIKIGIESSCKNLHCDILTHPARYFFILAKDGQAFLCIRTCDMQGDDIVTHIIDGLNLNGEGKLYSVFEDGINDTILEMGGWKRRSCQGDEYPISYLLERTISMMPDLVEWIISSILVKGSNLVINPIGNA